VRSVVSIAMVRIVVGRVSAVMAAVVAAMVLSIGNQRCCDITEERAYMARMLRMTLQAIHQAVDEVFDATPDLSAQMLAQGSGSVSRMRRMLGHVRGGMDQYVQGGVDVAGLLVDREQESIEGRLEAFRVGDGWQRGLLGILGRLVLALGGGDVEADGRGSIVAVHGGPELGQLRIAGPVGRSQLAPAQRDGSLTA
jgi:hypothetical protein